ncbi:PREDICTED: neurofilament medium polypeptide-like [Populus euphratica]|uniref:Neurofilament medium polypeptide-like n=1 Tax=Populus euphratica TaxID=75702 RepID=A0AAJ6Y1Q0_POPEU|nr:PREDICTED: neurofilament medium polypeptide-like [Populus euphratica]
MATETAPSHQTPSDHEPMEKVAEVVKPEEPEIVSVAKKTEEEDLKSNELASQSTPSAKSEGEAEDEAEPPTDEVKMINDAPIVDVLVYDEKELEKDSIPDSHTSSVLAPVTSVVNGESVAPAIEFVPKEAEEQPLSSSLAELPLEEPKTVDVPVSLEEAIEKPHEPSEVLIIKESEPIVAKNTKDSGVLKEVDKPELVIPEVEVKLQEQSEVGKQVEKPKTEVIEKPEEPLEVIPIKSEALVVKDAEDSEPVLIEEDKPESELVIPEMEVKLEEQSEVIKKVEPEEKSVEVIAKTQELAEVLPTKESEAVLVKDIDGSQKLSKEADKVEAVAPEPREVKMESEVTEQVEKTGEKSVEAIEKTQDSSEVHPVKESEAVAVKDIDDSVAVPEVDKPESAVPEVEVKQEEQSEVMEQVEKPESAVPQVEVKLVEQPEVTEQVEKTESLGPEVEVKPEEQPEVTTHTEKQKKHEVELKTEARSEVSEQVEIKPTNEKPEEVAGITQEAEVDVKEDIGKSSLPEVVGKVGSEDEKKEAEGTDPVEVPVKEVVGEAEKGGEEKEAQTTKDEGENIASETLKEELAHPIKVEDVSDAVSNAEVTEKSFEGEKTVENVVPAVEDKKEEIPAGEETEKDQKTEGKLDEATTNGSKTAKESQDSGLEEKEEESAKNNKENSEQEKFDEIAKSDAQILEPSTTKDADDIKVSQDLPREVPAKPTQKHSNNILTKVKQSLVKAKKAIIGKSPTPKTVSSDTKGDVKVNN